MSEISAFATENVLTFPALTLRSGPRFYPDSVACEADCVPECGPH
jgi:hypothetical protein